MRRALLFLMLAGAGTIALLELGGGLEGPRRSMPQAIVEQRTEPLADGPKIELGAGSPDVDAIEGITQPAPPRRIVWQDPLSDERIEIPTFVPWRFQAQDARPLPTPSGERQGVLSRNVHFQMFRDPKTRAEAVALARNEPDAYAALLHQDFTAKEARVYGRLGEALTQQRSEKAASAGLGDTELRLTRDVVLVDRSQGLEIRGQDMRIWPEQDRAEGDGPFTLTHAAMVLSGTNLELERDDARGWSRVAMSRNPVLRIVAEGRDRNGKPIFDFGPGEFRPATVACTGRAILVRQEGRGETAITVSFSDDVRAVQRGGRTLSADRAELVASRPGPAVVPREGGWRLQRFQASRAVKLEYPGETRRGAEYLTSISADRLTHDVPDVGLADTVLEGNVTILLRGEIALLGPGGRLRLDCRDRASIGPLPAGAPDGGLDRTTLQQIRLRGGARIEREIPGPQGERDALEADAIDLVVQPQRDDARTRSLDPQTRMRAVHFAALGDVLVNGTRLRGATHRLVGDDLHTEHPLVTAEGEGTWFDFPVASDQRLLGPDRAAAPAPDAAEAPPAQDQPRDGRWALQRLLARGDVDITTSVGGPALGIPAHLQGDEVSYDRVSRRARLVSTGAAPARIAWSASRTQTNTVETRALTLDRSGGRITASGGVRGELYVAERGTGSGFRFPPGPRRGGLLRGSTLSVRTDERIDIRLLRTDTTSWRPAPGKEQVIRIAGPVTTELRAADSSVDRMRSASLEVALVYLPPSEEAAPASTPAARAGPERRAPTGRAPAPQADVALQRLDVEAQAVRIDMQAGDVSFLEATGDVDLKSRAGHVRGERLTYAARDERIGVTGTAKRHAVAFFGSTDQRSEVRAARLELRLRDGAPVRVEAHAPQGGTSDVHLYRDGRAARGPGPLEWFAVTYEGTAVITAERLRAGRVRVIRRLRAAGARDWGEPAVLRSPTLEVRGRRLLASEDGARDIRRIVAQGLQGGPRGDVHFLSGKGDQRLQIWGQRFDFDVLKREAQLTGLPGRDVTMQRGDGLHARYIRVTIDMKTNLPTAEGSRILWRPRAPR